MTQNAWDSSSTLVLANGGTNATSMATSTGIVKYDGTRLVTSSTDKIDSSNRNTNTSQPDFLVTLASATRSNVTGDGTVYTVIFDTEVTDQGSNFDISTGIFTAPITGKYMLQFSARLTGGSNITAAVLKIVTTARTYTKNMNKVINDSGQADGKLMVIANMTASDTASFAVQSTDSGGKTDDLNGAATVRTFASGCLLC